MSNTEHHSSSIHTARHRTLLTSATAYIMQLCIGIALYIGLTSTSHAEKMLADIPDFLLESQSGEMVSLSELKGQVVVVNFWATWCRPCLVEMPLLEAMYQDYKEQGLTILGINIEDARGATKKAAIDQVSGNMRLSFPILYDSEKNVMRNIEKYLLYNNMGLPTTLFIGRQGKTRYLHQGYRKGDETMYIEVIKELLQE